MSRRHERERNPRGGGRTGLALPLPEIGRLPTIALCNS
jgi:hypothetical protein